MHALPQVSCVACEESELSASHFLLSFPQSMCSRGASVGGTVGFTLLIVAAISAVFAIVWRSEPAVMPHSSPYSIVKAFTIEDRVAPNFVRVALLLWIYRRSLTLLSCFLLVDVSRQNSLLCLLLFLTPACFLLQLQLQDFAELHPNRIDSDQSHRNPVRSSSHVS